MPLVGEGEPRRGTVKKESSEASMDKSITIDETKSDEDVDLYEEEKEINTPNA